MSDTYERFQNQIIAAAFLAPVFGGGILYYGLRNHDEDIAKKANRLSWIAFLAWIGFIVMLNAVKAPSVVLSVVGPVCGVSGIVLAIMLLSNIKRDLGGTPTDT